MPHHDCGEYKPSVSTPRDQDQMRDDEFQSSKAGGESQVEIHKGLNSDASAKKKRFRITFKFTHSYLGDSFEEVQLRLGLILATIDRRDRQSDSQRFKVGKQASFK